MLIAVCGTGTEGSAYYFYFFVAFDIWYHYLDWFFFCWHLLGMSGWELRKGAVNCQYWVLSSFKFVIVPHIYTPHD